MTLAAQEFRRRFLLHIVPHGFQRLRPGGFLANRWQARALRPSGPLYRPARWLLPGQARPPPLSIAPAPKMDYHATRGAGLTHGKGSPP